MTTLYKVGKLPGSLTEYGTEDSITVKDALKLAKVTTTNVTVQVNGSTITDYDRTVRNGDRITVIAAKVKGN